MNSNYRNHLLFEFTNITELERQSAADCAVREARWQRDIDRTKSCEKRLMQLLSAESSSKASFRKAHRAHSTLRTDMGEIEEELFPFAEVLEY